MDRRGWKVGINVPEVLQHLDLPHPGIGWLDGQRIFSSGVSLGSNSEAKLHVEPEIAISLSQGVSPGSSAEIARRSIDCVYPALEVVDYARPTAGLDDVLAHCMFHDATILGAPTSLDSVRDLGVTLPVVRVGERSSDAPRGDLVPSDLGELIAFVSDFLAAFDQSLEPGDLVMSGSYIAEAVAIRAGEEAVADFGSRGIVLVKVSAE